MIEGGPVAHGLPLDHKLTFVVVVPDRPLPTHEARLALPTSVTHADAVFNLGRMGLLIAGLSDHRRLVAAAAEDRLHQRWRGRLFPEGERIMVGLLEGGASAVCWSGAGPSILAICTVGTEGAVAQGGQSLLALAGLSGQVLQLAPDHTGLTVRR
jgi:homoserine kinase